MNTGRWWALSLCQSVISGSTPRHDGEHGDADAEPDGQVVGSDPGFSVRLGRRIRLGVRAHSARQVSGHRRSAHVCARDLAAVGQTSSGGGQP